MFLPEIFLRRAVNNKCNIIKSYIVLYVFFLSIFIHSLRSYIDPLSPCLTKQKNLILVSFLQKQQ